MFRLLGLGDDCVAAGESPAKDDLAGGLGVLACEVSNELVTLDVVTVGSILTADAAQRTVGDRHHLMVK